MKRIAFLSLLMVPSAVGAQQHAPVHSAAYSGGHGPAVGTSVDQGLAQYDQRPVLSQHCENGCPTHFNTACGQSGGWFGDIGFYVLRPQWSGGNPAFATTTTDGITTTYAASEFDHDYSFAPLVQLGYAGRNGLGVRGRWWTLRNTENVPAGGFEVGPGVNVGLPGLLGTTGAIDLDDPGLPFPVAGIPFTTEGNFSNRLSMDVIDLEGIWDTTVGRSSLLFSAGVRYAHIGQTYDAAITAAAVAAPGIAATTLLRANNTFSGAGPTVAMQGYRMIGNTNLSVYGISRGSLLFGESRQRASTDFALLGVNNTSTAEIFSDSVRPVMELEVGTNWTRNMGAYDLFLENGLVGMMWFNAGNAANSDAIAVNADAFSAGNYGSFGSQNANQDMGLIGLRFSAGVRF